MIKKCYGCELPVYLLHNSALAWRVIMDNARLCCSVNDEFIPTYLNKHHYFHLQQWPLEHLSGTTVKTAIPDVFCLSVMTSF